MNNKKNKGKHTTNDLVIMINEHNSYVRFFDKTEPIIEGVLMINVPDGSCQLLEMKDVYIASDYNFAKSTWYAFVKISNLSYKISRKRPYYGNYSIVMYIKSASFIIVVVLAKPTLCEMPISGLLIDVGIKGHNYHQVAEATSAMLRIMADDDTRAILDKEWTEEFCKENDEAMLSGYVDSTSDEYGEYSDDTYEEEENLYG